MRIKQSLLFMILTTMTWELDVCISKLVSTLLLIFTKSCLDTGGGKRDSDL